MDQHIDALHRVAGKNLKSLNWNGVALGFMLYRLEEIFRLLYMLQAGALRIAIFR